SQSSARTPAGEGATFFAPEGNGRTAFAESAGRTSAALATKTTGLPAPVSQTGSATSQRAGFAPVSGSGEGEKVNSRSGSAGVVRGGVSCRKVYRGTPTWWFFGATASAPRRKPGSAWSTLCSRPSSRSASEPSGPASNFSALASCAWGWGAQVGES